MRGYLVVVNLQRDQTDASRPDSRSRQIQFVSGKRLICANSHYHAYICIRARNSHNRRSRRRQKAKWLSKKYIKHIVRSSQIAHRRYLRSAPDSTVAKCVNKNRKSPRFPGDLNRVDVFVSVDVPNRHRKSYLALRTNVRTFSSWEFRASLYLSLSFKSTKSSIRLSPFPSFAPLLPRFSYPIFPQLFRNSDQNRSINLHEKKNFHKIFIRLN